jgi:hypothetical protein
VLNSRTEPPRPSTTPQHGSASYAIAALVTAVVIALPFLAVDFTPITDLPQQAAQIKLATEVLDGSNEYRFNILAPGTLSYGLFAVGWRFAGAGSAGRIAYLLLACLWLGAFAVVAREYRRDPVLVPLTGLFFFSQSLYLGFASFLFGAVAFLVFICFERWLQRRRSGPGEIAALTVAGILLYTSHLLWFVAAAAWLAIASLRADMPRRRLASRIASMLPALALTAVWMPQLAQSGFHSPTTWGTLPWARLAPGELILILFGGLLGPVEPFVLSAVLAWIAIALWQHRADLRSAVNVPLLKVAGVMLLLALALPHLYQNTLNFGERWAPVGAAVLVVALPPPKFRSWLKWALSLLLIAGLSLSTTAVWNRFEEVELTGLEASLAALPERPRLLGLDFYRLSRFVRTQPFYQIPAYAQVLKGGSLGFTFASFPASPVVYREWENTPWSPGLEWFPHHLLDSMEDVGHFDYLLIHAGPNGHELFYKQDVLEPVTPPDRWRLYRVLESAPPPTLNR